MTNHRRRLNAGGKNFGHARIRDNRGNASRTICLGMKRIVYAAENVDLISPMAVNGIIMMALLVGGAGLQVRLCSTNTCRKSIRVNVLCGILLGSVHSLARLLLLKAVNSRGEINSTKFAGQEKSK